MALPLIGAALAGLGRLAVGAVAGAGRVAGTAATSTTARIGYGAALGDLAKDAIVGTGKGLVGGLKGAMMSEAPGIAGAYAFGKDLRKRANAPRMPSSGSAPPPVNKSKSSSPVIGGLGSLNTTSIVVAQKQSNIINLEQVRQLKQLNDSVINQSKLISYQIDDTRRKNQFAEEAANEQAIRDDKLLEAIRNIGSGGGGGGKRGGGEAANDSSSGGFLSSLLGSVAGGAGANAISKLLPLLSAAMAALPWARILKFAGGPASVALALTGDTPSKEQKEKYAAFEKAQAEKKRIEDAAEDAKPKPRPTDFKPVGNNPNSFFNQREKKNTEIKQENWDKTEKGRRNPVDGKLINAAPPAPGSAPPAVTVPPAVTAPVTKGLYSMPANGKVSSLQQDMRDLNDGKGAKPHNGVDYAMEPGSYVTPIRAGIIDYVDEKGTKSTFGRHVIVDHGDGIKSTYAHLSAVGNWKKGNDVAINNVLGLSGGAPDDKGAGHSKGPHLHLEIKQGSKFLKISELSGLELSGVLGASVNRNPESPAAANSPASTAPVASTAQSGDAKKLKVIRSSADIDATPATNFIKQNDANKQAIKAEQVAKAAKESADKKSSGIKDDILKSLPRKSLEELKSLKAEASGFTGSGVLQFYGLLLGLTPSDKSEVIKAIDKEIEKRAAVVSTSDALVGKGFAGLGLDSPLFAKTNMQANPNALVVASVNGLPGGSGSKFEVKKEAILVNAPDVVDAVNTNTRALGFSPVTSQPLATSVAYTGGNALPTKAFKPLFQSNSDILADANKAFLKDLRGTFTNIFKTGLTEALLPNGVGVSASQAGQDDMYRGQQLKQINDTSKKINEGAIDLFGKKFGPMFAPMLDKLSTSYFEVGARSVGKAIFQGIGDLDAKDTMTLTGQVLGNYAAGKKELAFEQLLYGASGGKNGGIALGTETLFAKYGFKDPMEGISYFANALGEKATQPFAKMMGADDRSKSLTFEPRSGRYINNDTGRYATQAEVNAANIDYGSRVSQTPMFDPSINNFGVPGAPYQTTAGTGGNVLGGTTNNSLPASMGGPRGGGSGSAFQQVLKQQPGKETITRNQFFGTSPEYQAAGGERLIAEQNTLIRAQVEKQNIQIDQTRKLAEDSAKRDFKIADEMANNQEESDAARSAFDKAMNDAKTGTDRQDAGAIIEAINRASGKAGDGSPTSGLKPGGGRQPGQLFDANVYGKDKDGKTIIDGKDVFKEIGNFGFDMLKNAAGNALTKDIKNPYMQMVANFAIQKGLNYGVEALLGKTGETGLLEKGFSYVTDNAPSFIEKAFSWYSGSARGGPITGPGSGTSDSIPTMLSNGEFVVNAKASKENMALLTAINASGLTQGFALGGTVGSGTEIKQLRIDERGGGNDAGRGPTVGSPGGPDALGIGPASDRSSFRDMVEGINSMHPLMSAILGFALPGFSILSGGAKLAGWAIDKKNLDASNVEGGQSQTMSQAKGVFRGLERSERNDTESSGARNFGKESSIPQGGMVSPGVTSGGRDGNGGLGNSGSGAGTSNGGAQAEGGPITGPGSGTSDSIPAMLSNGEFVVNAIAAKKYRPLLDALNLKHYADGTPAADGSVAKTLANASGQAETNNQLAVSNETLTSIDGSLRTIAGKPRSGSGTAITGTGSGLSFDTGLGGFGGPAGASSVMGTATGGGGGGGRSAPSTMDIIGNVAATVAKGYLIKAGITAVTGGMMGSLGAVLPSMYGAYSFAGGGMAGIAAAAESGVALTSMALVEGATALGSALSTAGTFLLTNPVGWALLGALAIFSIFGGGGGGGSRPLPKEPKFHAAMYVSGNNDPNAIAPIYETTDYHAVPDTFKTIAYGLLRVAFNATKTAEAVTKIPSPWDWLYIKIQFDKISLIWGKGAPPKQGLLADSYPDNMSWAAPGAQTNLNSVASDIIDKITQEFKDVSPFQAPGTVDSYMKKLDTAAIGLKNYSLDELSSGLIEELKSGNLKLDPKIKKGIYAADVNESNRISSLILAATSKAAYITDSEGNPIASNTIPDGGSNMVYSMKQGKFVKNPYGLDTILLDAQDRPVYDIEGTSAGLTIDDFVSAEKAGKRTANILAPPVTAGSAAGGGGATVVNAPSVVNNDASSLVNYYQTNQTAIDALRAAQTQTG